MMEEREHGWYEELVPAYAVGATDEEERRAVEHHLRRCPGCRTLLADYQEIGDGLLFSVPGLPARAGLTDDLRKRLRAGETAHSGRPWAALLRRPVWALALAALLVMVATNLYWAGRVSRLESESVALTDFARAPAFTLVSAQNAAYAGGVVYVPERSDVGLLCVYDLPQLETGRTYQAWLIRGNERISGGTFNVNPDGYGVLVVRAAQPLSDFDGLGITVEPAGGSPAPTTPRLMGTQL